jgi:hypothetical protein
MPLVVSQGVTDLLASHATFPVYGQRTTVLSYTQC